MKIFGSIVGILVVIIVLVYTMVFTPVGNSMLQPTIQQKINEATKLNTKLSKFSLSMSDFEIFLELDSANTIYIKGDYALLSKSFDIVYDIKLQKLQNLQSLTSTPLKGSFNTDGTVKGDLVFLKVDGKSDVASSATTYHVELSDLNPTSIIAKVQDADLVALLELGAQKPYANGKLDLDINFKNIKPHALDGDIMLVTKNTKLNTSLLNKDLNLSIPKTDFTMNLDAKLKGDDVDYVYKLDSNLVKLTSDGKVIPQPLKVDIKYGVDVEELAILKPITNADVRGAFRLNGSVKGDKANMSIDGKSDVASSDTTFVAILKNFAPDSLKASMKNLKLKKVLYMVKQPHYADGVFSLDVDMSSLKTGNLKGDVESNIKNGVVDSKYITKAYKFKSPMPKTTFTLSTKTELNGDIADTKVDLKSSLANFEIEKASVNLKDSSIISDYKATIGDLSKLFFATQRKMKGSIVATGELKKAKDLDLTMYSKVADGDIDVKLHNDDLHADLKALQTLKILDMLIYPEVFKSSLNGVLDYNLLAQKGKFSGTLVDGKFTQNQMLTLLKKYAKEDLYKQKFKGDVDANINKENILASLSLKSNTSSIITKNTKINSKSNKINSKIDIVANKHPLSLTIKGDINSPKINIDANELIKSQAKDAIIKKLNKKDSKLGNILKGFL
jgi:hypothetical protein